MATTKFIFEPMFDSARETSTEAARGRRKRTLTEAEIETLRAEAHAEGFRAGEVSALEAIAAATNAVVFRTQHVTGVKGLVLEEGPGLVVYTFTGDKPGHAGTCTGACAGVWPPVHGVAVLASGTKIGGKFGRIDGQVTFNGWPLYLFTGEKARQNNADSSFKVVRVSAPSKKPTA